MMKKRIVLLTALMAMSIGCVGMGVTVSPGDGRISLDLMARDCITGNLAGRTLGAIPVVGDWAMLHWGCSSIAETSQ